VRYLVITDIHGNLEALDAVLGTLSPLGVDRVLVLGDLVGYGADPNAVVERIRAMEPQAIVRGNHDKVASGIEDGESFNLVARSAVQWTNDALTAENLDYLASLPPGPVAVDDRVEICHGSPFDEDAYIFDELDALKALESASRPVCLFGHTHVAVAYRRTEDRIELAAGPGDTDLVRLPIDPQSRYLVNVGSVGQPRDGDSRAGAGIIDTSAGVIELYRVRYAIEEAQRKIRLVGLPEVLARRLALGR
jgi:diadenosine tetraphosphatase ApaH/serine/threonine PP2A family protein phosphatase